MRFPHRCSWHWLAQQVNGGNNFARLTVRLTEDIYLDGHEWTPIGNGYREDSTPLGESFCRNIRRWQPYNPRPEDFADQGSGLRNRPSLEL